MDIGHDDGDDDYSYESGLGKTDQWVSLTGGHDEGNHHYSYSYEYMMGWTGQTLGSSALNIIIMIMAVITMMVILKS